MKLSKIISINLAAVAAAGLLSLSGCSDDYDGFKLWDNAETEQPTMKPRYIWVDAAANFKDFANSQENIARDLTLARDAGFTDIVVDVRPTTGDILFKSSYCQEVPSLKAWVDGVYTDVYRTASWDYLQAFIDKGHELGLRIHAGFNTMVGGNRGAGILYRDPSKKEWATYVYNGGNPVNVMDLADNEKFFNPNHPEVQEYICNLLGDLAKYDLDGIVLDRGRYQDLYSDFSPTTRTQFEEYLDTKLQQFPGDILPAGTTSSTLATPYSTYTTKWLEFRAKTIHDFMEKARNAVKSVNPDILFGVYVGGWYRSYYSTGANWASPSFDPSKKWEWASRKYKDYGYADLMDHMLIGAYANPTAVNGSDEWSMEGFCIQAMQKTLGDCPLVVGGPNVDWRWNSASSVYTKEQILTAITESVEACIDACDGYFLFDMIHLKIDPEKWDAVSEGIHGYIDNWDNRYGES